MPSPSRRFGDSPLRPTRAFHGPAAGFQQPASRRQSRSVAWVDDRLEAPTVISCVPVPVAGRHADGAASAEGGTANKSSRAGKARASTLADYG